MRHIITIIIAVFIASGLASGQDKNTKSYTRQGDTFVQGKTSRSSSSDFAIAECYGDNAIKDTYRRASKEWIEDHKFFTELALVLNWYCWFWYDNGEPGLSALYSDLFYKSKDAFYKAWNDKKTDSESLRSYKEEARSYFFHTLD